LTHRRYSLFTSTFKIILLILVLEAVGSAQATYTITDLGTVGGSISSGLGINASGQVTGSSDPHAFLYSRGTMTDLGTLGGPTSVGRGINGSGQVTGQADTSATNTHAFLYSQGVMNDLQTLPGYSNSIGWGINAAGQVTGYSYSLGSSAFRAFVYSSGTLTDLGTLGGASSFGYGINASGQITGQADTTTPNASHAFLYSAGTMTDLGTLPGFANSAGYSINALGQIIGECDTNNGPLHAFLYSGGTMTDLGTLGGTQSWAFSINDSGQVVGWSKNTPNVPDFFARAFLYTSASGMVDLNTLVPPNSGWTLQEAHSINDRGQITGFGISPDGDQHAFLLTPIPARAAGAGTSPVANAKLYLEKIYDRPRSEKTEN